MTTLLILAHLAVFLVTVLWDTRRGINRLRNMSIPVGVAFLYISVVQATSAADNPGRGLNASDIEVALLVSLSLYAGFYVTYRLTRGIQKKVAFADRQMNCARLNGFAWLFYCIGLVGYYLSIRAVGGLRAYLRLTEWESYLYDVSGYIYMLKFAVYAAVALWLLCLALNRLHPRTHIVLAVTMFALLFEAVQTTDRGDTIRASLPIVAWLYFLARHPGRSPVYRMWVNVITVIVCLSVAAGVLLFPEFRGMKRSLMTSEVTLTEAIERVQQKQGSSRLSEEGGGEFDSAARIIKRVRIGEIDPPGPVHIARLFWNVVPRALVPDKWEQFNAWAGIDFQEIWVGSTSYYGCTPTGWGEAYGCMGWLGALFQWCLFGFLVKKYETWFSHSKSGLMVSVISYLPLMNYVVMTFFSASMTFCTVVLPVLGVLWLCRGPRKTRQRSSRRRSGRSSAQPENVVDLPGQS